MYNLLAQEPGTRSGGSDEPLQEQETPPMPKVGKKRFSYSKKGRAAAKKYARKTGKKVSKRRKGY